MIGEFVRPAPEYKRYPALAAYIDRVGAEELNFRKFIIREWTERQNGKRYYSQKALIEIRPEGEIVCTDPAFDPTPEERAEIKIAAKTFNWPKFIKATLAGAESQRIKLGVKREHWFVCVDRNRKDVLWCQLRREKETGDKDYYAWSFWNDAKWRPMEPDGPLPFWKPAERRNLGAIMVHEGAKAARQVDWMVNSLEPEARAQLAAHPWGETLKTFEHWGMMGGALSPHRADYDELRAEKPSEVIYVCDRDDPGEAALQKVSRAYRGALIGVKFDTRWPTGWDLADPMPQSDKLFKSDRHGVAQYVGPSFDELTVPATWATETVLIEGKPKVVLRQEFKDEWVHVVSPEAFINKRKPSRVYFKASEFNSRVRPFSDLRETDEELKKDDKGKVDALAYSPAMPSGVVAGTPRTFNTYQPAAVVPKPGRVLPFLRYITHLFPIKADRIEVLRWIATILARPDVKMSYGLLLVSETQGVGKSTLGENILRPLLGKTNVSFPSETEITEGQFTGWKAHKHLVFVHEIYAGTTPKAYNKLKDFITERFVRVNEKFVAPYEIENWCHVVACSNSMRALKLPDDDRRWLVPKVTEKQRPHRYWVEFNHWLETGGLPIILQWASDFVRKRGVVERGQHAPYSTAKRRMVEESYSPGQLLVAGWLDTMRACASKECGCDPGKCLARRSDEQRGAPVVVTDKALVEMIKIAIHDGRQSDRLEKDRTIRKLAKARGWHLGEEPYFIAPGKSKATLISTDPDLALKTPAAIRKMERPPRIIDEPPV